MKIYRKLMVLGLVFVALFGFSKSVFASTPTLSLSSNGVNSVYLSVNGDANSTVTLYYNSTNYGYGSQNAFLGYTNASGFFSATINPTTYNIVQGNMVYVSVNNQPSLSVAWPIYNSYNNNSGSLSLSQSNVSLNIGQTTYVTANNSYGTLYVSSNSNSNVVTASLLSNSISLYGVNSGSSTVTICQSVSSNYCGTIYVTVAGNYYNNNNYTNYNNTLGLIVSNLNLSVGNSITLNAPNGSGLYVSSNSNPAIASTNTNTGCYGVYNTATGLPCYNQNNYYPVVNNGPVTISALSIGTDTITLCQSGNTSACSTIAVNVNGNGSVLGVSTVGVCSFYRTLKYGMSGSDVSCLQTLLTNKGYLTNGINSGYFDLQTKNAVMVFQQDNYLYADGVVGRRTASLLYN